MLKTISGKWVDILNRRICEGTFTIENGQISSFKEEAIAEEIYILPGFIDAHIHIESSMLLPYEFARIALTHGTVATVSDPHEIANVLGLEGVYYMLENAKDAKLKFHFGAPSCVPATSFESSGAVMGPAAVETLLQRDDIFYLSEMMNYPGVLYGDQEVLQKIALAKHYNKPVDGHAPGLRGKDVKQYIDAGISTDHECFTLDEALEKISHGMKILIREGSAARNFEALHPLLRSHPESCMFCCDDKHPDELLLGHINLHVSKAIALGYDLYDVLYAACIHPVMHYNLPVGILRPGDPADFIITKNLADFKPEMTVINGEVVAEKGNSFLPEKKHHIINNFNSSPISPTSLEVNDEGNLLRVIEAYDGQLITGEYHAKVKVEHGLCVADPENDILKIAVVNRYAPSLPSVAFIKNIGLKRGAIASSVAHDSHNIIVVGADDASMCKAVNLLFEHRGGLSLVDGPEELVIALPVAGLMSDRDCLTIGKAYAHIDHKAKELGSSLRAPYMTLSFMALLVIPSLKISDKGIFDGNSFRFTSLFV
ncbi:MAG: adenine deaminase [Bacteroidetes bacterium]|nr:adenine deaminase [Bacteroidota bacterium]